MHGYKEPDAARQGLQNHQVLHDYSTLLMEKE